MTPFAAPVIGRAGVDETGFVLVENAITAAIVELESANVGLRMDIRHDWDTGCSHDV